MFVGLFLKPFLLSPSSIRIILDMGSFLEHLFSKETKVLLFVLFEGICVTICDYISFPLPSVSAVLIHFAKDVSDVVSSGCTPFLDFQPG